MLARNLAVSPRWRNIELFMRIAAGIFLIDEVGLPARFG